MSDDNPTPTIDLNSPEIQALIEKEVAGLKANRDEVFKQKQALKEELDQFKSQYSGVNLDEYRSWNEKLKQDETARLIAEGKIDDVLNQRVQAMQQDYEQKLQTTSSQAELYKSKVLDGYIATAAAQAGVDPSALDLVSLLAKQSGVTLDGNGNPVVTNQNGDVVYSKDGVTPLSMNEWLAGLRASKPLLWGQPQGGGSGGGQGNHQTLNPKEMSVQDIKDLRERDPAKYEQLFPKK